MASCSQTHPVNLLSLSLSLCLDGSVLHLFNYYLMNLNIMTVKAKVSTATDLTGAISAGYVSATVFVEFGVCDLCCNNCVLSLRELLNSDTLLNCLYAKDQGRETPNPSNRYQFDKVG